MKNCYSKREIARNDVVQKIFEDYQYAARAFVKENQPAGAIDKWGVTT